MRFSQTTNLDSPGPRFLPLMMCLAALFFWPASTRADEISFVETYLEKFVDGEVVATGSSTLEILLPWNGAVNINDFNNGTEINISIGEFQFSQVLGAAENYDEGDRSARFRETEFDDTGKSVDVLFFEVSWNTKTFKISGVTRNLGEGSASENYFGAKSYPATAPGTINISEPYEASVRFGDFDVTHTVAVIGKNTPTRKVILDEDGDIIEEVFLNRVNLSGKANLPPNDTKNPTVSITSPAANGKLLTPLMTGKASDNSAIAEVFYRVGDGDFVLAQGTTNWSADFALEPEEGETEVGIMLAPGHNTVQVKSMDSAGNESPVVTRTFFYALSSPVEIEISGEGTTTITNGQRLELGAIHTITAKPAPAWLFQEWLGNTINSGNSTVSFTMETGLFLQASFIPNPFIPAQGIYNGIFTNSDAIHPSSAGFLTLTLKDSGAFSGKILLNGARHSISGIFNPGGSFNKTILRRSKPSLDVRLQLDFEGGVLGGQIVQGDVASMIEAQPAQSAMSSAKTNYTLLIPPGNNPATSPGGYGSGSISIDTKGKLKFKGVLGDGTTVSQATMISANGRFPFFLPLYKGKGVLLGWQTFTGEPDNDVTGEITWAKLHGAPGKLYTNGFTIFGELIGSQYTIPTNGLPIVNWIDGLIEFNNGNLKAPLTNGVAVGDKNKLIISSTNKTSLSLAPSQGLLKGKFAHPDTGKNAAVKGAFLQKRQLGGGLFVGTNQTGSVLLESTAAESLD